MEDTYDRIKELIARYLAGEATDGERETVERWTGESPEHHLEFSRLRNIWETAHPPFDPDSVDLAAAHRRVMRSIRPVRRSTRLLRYWQRAAAVLLLPLLALTVYFAFFRPVGLLTGVTASNEIRIPSGTSSRVVLPDSSIVWLNGGSTLTYPVHFSGGYREVTLDGEAFFEVVSDRKNPFTVRTSRLSVIATGTAFNVEAYGGEEIAAVTLAEGVVGVELNKNQTVTLKPNERLTLDSRTNRYSVGYSDAEKWSSWKDGVMMFRDDELGYIFGRLSRIYNVEIRITDEQIGRYLYRATFREESLDEILNLIRQSAPIEYRDRGRTPGPDGVLSHRVIEVYTR